METTDLELEPVDGSYPPDPPDNFLERQRITYEQFVLLRRDLDPDWRDSMSSQRFLKYMYDNGIETLSENSSSIHWVEEEEGRFMWKSTRSIL